MDDIKLTEHIVVCLDILGFEKAVSDLENMFKNILNALKEINFHAQQPVTIAYSKKENKTEPSCTEHSSMQIIEHSSKEGTIVNEVRKFKFCAFSDSLILTSSESLCINSFLALAGKISVIQSSIFSLGFLSRGYLTKGKLYHEDQIIFGEPVITAYKNERNNVFLPRVNIDETLIRALKDKLSHLSKKSVDKVLLRDESMGPAYINYIDLIIQTNLLKANEIIEKVNDALLKHERNGSVFQKWRWFANLFCIRFNELVKNNEIQSTYELKISENQIVKQNRIL